MSPATENVNGKTEVSRKRKTSIDREDSLKKHDFREDETKSNQEEEKQADECRGGEEKQSKHKHRHHKHKHRSHRKHRHENRCEDQDARVKPKRMVVGEKMEDDREEGEILEEESPSAVSLKMGNRDAEKKNDRDKSRVAAVQVDGKAEVVFQSVLKIAEAYDSDERTSVEIIVPKANTGSPQEVVQSLPSEEDLNHSISREVALNERQRSRSQESVRDHRHMVKEEKKLKVDEQGHQSSSKAEDDDRHARNEGKHEIKTSSSSKDPSRDYKVDGTNADKVRHNDTDSIDKGHGRSRSPDKKDARGRERSRSRDRQRSKSRERQSRTRQPSRSRDRQRSRSRDRNSHCRQRSRSRDRRDYERSSRSRAYSPRRRRSRSRDSLLERRGDESSYLHGHRHEESREKSSRAGESRDKYDWATRADHRHTTNRDRNRERSGHVQERERDMRHHEYENNTNVFEDKARDEENQEEDYMERVASQLAEQEEDDVEKIKEESRKRRQAILEKYKQQHSNGQPDNGKKEVGDAIFFNETSAELERRPLDEGETAQLSLPLALGKLPLENGNSMVPRFRNSALGEGSPAKSEISGGTFCDDIFGESPAGGHRAGKGDGITVETSDLIDNWDDHQGYYTYRLGEVLDLRYEIASSHGRGVFSSVVRARDSRASGDEPEEVAIKIIRNNETMYKAGQQELVILKKLAGADPENRRHCVRLLSSFEYRNHLCLVFESLHMNLREVLKKFGRNIGINMQAVRSYAKQLFIALKHLRNCGVLHCDIKPDNMLVNESKNVLKLCDFGSAMFAGENEITPYLVSRFYRAPEIMLGLPYDHALDMWSVGCCLYEFYTGKVLFPGKTNNDMLRLHMELKGPFPKKMLKRAAFAGQHFDQDYNFCAVEEDPVTKKVIKRVFNSVKPKDINALITGSGTAEEDQKMLNNFKHLMDKIFILDPEKRLTVSQALNHPFITGK